MNVILTIVIKTICSFFGTVAFGKICLLYTSDAADD